MSLQWAAARKVLAIRGKPPVGAVLQGRTVCRVRLPWKLSRIRSLALRELLPCIAGLKLGLRGLGGLRREWPLRC